MGRGDVTMARVVVAGVAVLTGMSAGNAAGQTIRFDLLLSGDGGQTWSNFIEPLSGTRVLAAIFTTVDGGAYGVGGATFRLTMSGAIAGDTVLFGAGTSTGRVAPYNFGSATNAIFATGDGFRIDAASDVDGTDPTRGLTFMQRDPSSAGASFADASVARLCFAFEIQTSSTQHVRPIEFTMDELVGGTGVYYSSSSSTRGTRGAVVFDGASMFGSLPTPGALAMLGLGGLVMGRRRR
jgi:MYXO-CTERM domain-containing protein